MATFPFGWVRGIKDDNWQILWDSETKNLYVKSAVSKKVVAIGNSRSWEEAKALAGKVQSEPLSYLDFNC